MEERRVAIILLLVLCLAFSVFSSNIVFASSENWVEVTRFTGTGRLETDSFDCTHVDWRIRWSFKHSIEFGPLGPPLAFTISVYNVSGELVEKFFIATSQTSGTLNYNRTGSFRLAINEMYVDNWTVIVEQNTDSIPEFPSWIILPLVMVLALAVIVLKKTMQRI